MLTLLAVPALADGDDSLTDESDSGETITTGSSDAETEDDGLSKTAIAWIIVGAALVVVAVIFVLRYRAKIGGFFRLYKSELKKVSWLSWSQTKKSTLVVLVVLLVCAVVICLLDYALSSGFLAIINALK